MTDEQSPLISARGLTKVYDGRTVVDGIDLEVMPGEVYGLLGPNGAGKTTTILMLLGLTDRTAGEARVGGLDPTHHALTIKRRVGYLPDNVGFYEHMTGRQNLRFTADLNEIPTAEARADIDALLELVGLDGVGDMEVGTYSRGMRQRLGIADVLLKDPAVVILDEPTAAIDPQGVVQMQRLITRLAKEDGRAVLLSSHLLRQVQEICDRMAIFVSGRIVAEGSASQLGASMAGGRSRIEIVADTTGEELRRALDDIATEVEAAGSSRWRVTLDAADVPNLVTHLVAAGVTPTGIRDLSSDLDEIYHRYFQEEVHV